MDAIIFVTSPECIVQEVHTIMSCDVLYVDIGNLDTLLMVDKFVTHQGHSELDGIIVRDVVEHSSAEGRRDMHRHGSKIAWS